MATDPIRLTDTQGDLKKRVQEILPKGGNLDMCFTCGTCTSGCPASGVREDMDPRKFLRMVLMGMDEEIKKSEWIWNCSMCQRCVKVCPMEVDIPRMVYWMRQQVPREERPTGLIKSCDIHVKMGSATGVPAEDWEFVVEDVLDEVHEGQPDWADLQAPMDKEGAKYVLNQNSREPSLEPEEMIPLWKILHLGKVDWSYFSQFFAGENYCMFLADDENWEYILRKQVEAVEALGAEYYVNTECGHSFFAIWYGLQRFNIKPKFKFMHMVELYYELIMDGKLTPNSDWNKELGVKFTCQDPCQAVRKTMGDPFADKLRYIIKLCVGEENFIDMTPNRSNNYCCGGGGGALQAPYTEERFKYGKKKFDQIKATGATYVVTPCHNCHEQVMQLNEHYEGGYYTIHLWTLLGLAMGILGPEERTYLGPDLAELGLEKGE